jgi:replication factor A2
VFQKNEKMFSSSQFDATSAFSGGGFMPSQSTQLTDSTPSPAKASLLSLSLSVCFVLFC